MTRLPILLDSAMREKARLHPTSLALNLQLWPLSSATMDIPADEPEIRVGDWVELYTPERSAGIFRVASVTETVDDGMRKIMLDHGFGELADHVIYGKITPQDISGEDRATVTAILTRLFAKSTRWTLGGCAYTDTLAAGFENANLLQSVLDVGNALEGAYWEFDQTVTPWKAYLRKQQDNEAPGCEMRLTRNIDAMDYTLDRTEMFTRIYPLGKEGLTIAEVNSGREYLEKNVGTWGQVDYISTSLDIVDADLLKKTAQALLDRFCEPVVTVTVDAFDLAQATGEAMDDIRLGRVCRIPLPAYGTTILQRVTGLEWADVIHQPEKVTVTLANKAATLSGIAGATITQMQRQTYKVIRDQDEAIHGFARQTSESIDKFGNRITSAETAITQNAYQIELRAKTTEVDAVSKKVTENSAAIEVNSKAITSTVERVSGAEKTITDVKQTADGLTSRVTATENGLVTAESRIEQNARNITLQAEEINLKADTVYVDGEIQAVSAKVDTLEAKTITTENLSASLAKLTVLGANAIIAAAVTTGSLNIGLTNVGIHTLSVGGNSWTIVGTDDINFSVADTQEYKAGVSAARDGVTLTAGSWSNGTLTVSASNGKTKAVDLPAFSASGGTVWNANHQTTVNFSTSSVNTPLKSVTVDATSQYNAGGNAVTLAMSYNEDTHTYTTTATRPDGTTSEITSGTRSYTDGYSAGKADGKTEGASDVTLSSAGWVNGSNVVKASNGKQHTVSLPAFTTGGGTTWTTAHKTTVTFSTASVNTPLKSVTVDATSQYNAGGNAVTLAMSYNEDAHTYTTTATRPDGTTKTITSGARSYTDGKTDGAAGVTASSGTWTFSKSTVTGGFKINASVTLTNGKKISATSQLFSG